MGIVAVTDHVFPNLALEEGLLGEAGHELRYAGNASTTDDVIQVARGADAVLNCYAPMPSEVVRALDRCQIIARYGIGVDTIDVGEATVRGILVTNVPDYCIDEVSDHALALILALTRGIGLLDRRVRSGGWDPMDARPLRRLRGRTLGLIGFGRIARVLGAKAAGIGLRVLATDPFVPDHDLRQAGVETRSLEALADEADIISVHIPATEETRHLVGRDFFSRMRQGSLLVNTSRGSIVDTDALRAALASGRLDGAALDVLEAEPPSLGDSLLSHPNVIITPHAAFYSEESLAELQRKAAEQVVAALAGRVPPYALNPSVRSEG
jgi:D-3-phosphoglycerate dehydrogenase